MNRRAPTARRTARKTADATLGPEAWGPIARWTRDHRKTDTPGGMLIDPEAQPGIKVILAKARKLAHSQNMRIRLTHQEMDALYRQLRFWETCMDELVPTLRASAPPWEIFQEAALEIESAQIEAEAEVRTRQRGAGHPPAPRCNRCGRPVEGGGRATVDLDHQGRVTSIYTHPDC